MKKSSNSEELPVVDLSKKIYIGSLFENAEFFSTTVEEAVKADFRRAWRW